MKGICFEISIVMEYHSNRTRPYFMGFDGKEKEGKVGIQKPPGERKEKIAWGGEYRWEMRCSP